MGQPDRERRHEYKLLGARGLAGACERGDLIRHRLDGNQGDARRIDAAVAQRLGVRLQRGRLRGEHHLARDVRLAGPRPRGFGQSVRRRTVRAERQSDRHRHRWVELMQHTVVPQRGSEMHLGGTAGSLEVRRYRPPACRVRKRLGLLAAGRGGAVSAPVVEDPRDVADPVGGLDEAQHEVVVLGAVELGPKAARAWRPTRADRPRRGRCTSPSRRPPGTNRASGRARSAVRRRRCPRPNTACRGWDRRRPSARSPRVCRARANRRGPAAQRIRRAPVRALRSWPPRCRRPGHGASTGYARPPRRGAAVCSITSGSVDPSSHRHSSQSANDCRRTDQIASSSIATGGLWTGVSTGDQRHVPR